MPIKLYLSIMTLNEIKDKIDSILEDEILTNQVLMWHNKNQFIYFDNLCYVLNELLFHFELKKDIKVDIMTNTEFLKTYLIRKNGLEILPKDWINHQTKEIDNKILDDLWLEPTKGYLVKILEKSTDEKDKHTCGNEKINWYAICCTN
ncbi:MAG: hypothetical protein EAZ31_00685 [Cytophagia bacterium]|nr:MAG: hypothetical protein EAZ31_00685 [Cytophagia bacterium]